MRPLIIVEGHEEKRESKFSEEQVMTIEECRKILEDMRLKKMRARRMQREIEDLQASIDALSLPGSLSNPNSVHSGAAQSRVEQIVIRIETRQEAFMTALDEAMRAEDRLRYAVETLTPEEQDVIIECYMHGKTRKFIADLMGYSEETIKRRKRSAVRKIAQNYKFDPP